MKGIKEYTQHSVAFPTLSLSQPQTDSVNIGWNPKDGGTYGEMKFNFMTFRIGYGLRETTAMEISCFDDAVALLTTPELIELFGWLKRMSRERRDKLTPELLIRKLELLGFKASTYHKNPTGV